MGDAVKNKPICPTNELFHGGTCVFFSMGTATTDRALITG